MENKVICGIYKITNPKGATYIGKSKNISKRLVHYSNYLCEKQPKLYNSLKAWGFENHLFEVIEECEFEELDCRERYWQDEYNVLDREKGLNCVLTSCGRIPMVYSDSTRNNIKNASPNVNGENNPFFGKKHSQKTKDIWKAQRSGENSSWYGKKLTEEQKQIIRERQTGKIKSEETLKKMSIALSGHNNPKAEKVICTKTLGTWDCAKYCSADNGIDYTNLCNQLSGRTINRTTYMYLKDFEAGLLNLPFSNKTELILDIETGIFYYCYKEASKLYEIKPRTLLKMLRNEIYNKTNLIIC